MEFYLATAMIGVLLALVGWNMRILSKIQQETHELHSWHNQRDTDGVFIWYVRRSLEDAINKLADNVGAQTECFRHLVTELRIVRKLEDKA